MRKRLFPRAFLPLAALLALLAVMALDGPAAGAPDLTPEEEENSKTLLRPARYDDSDDKIELAVFFWYGCGACRESDPMTSMFVNSLPDDVRVVRLPALFDSMAPFETHGRLFLVLDELGVEPGARQAAFDTAQQVNNPNRKGYGLLSRESQETFAASQGVPRAAFNAAYDSPAVRGRETRIRNFMSSSDLDAVPAMVINGRYTRTFFQGPGYYQLAEKLIASERERLAAAAGAGAE
jgi:thiol:disulfide interchange protein DsbA